MSSFDRLSHFKSISDNFLHRPNFLKIPKKDILGPYRGKITIYGSNFQQVNLTPNGEYLLLSIKALMVHRKSLIFLLLNALK